jgi:hypothetical protein
VLVRPQVRGSAKHHVLEEMREPIPFRRLVLAADVVDHPHVYDGAALSRRVDDVHAVAQRLLGKGDRLTAHGLGQRLICPLGQRCRRAAAGEREDGEDCELQRQRMIPAMPGGRHGGHLIFAPVLR